MWRSIFLVSAFILISIMNSYCAAKRKCSDRQGRISPSEIADATTNSFVFNALSLGFTLICGRHKRTLSESNLHTRYNVEELKFYDDLVVVFGENRATLEAVPNQLITSLW